ncbi:hypothetical protein LINPERHAP2_LOCUS6889 [Linum perenne]
MGWLLPRSTAANRRRDLRQVSTYNESKNMGLHNSANRGPMSS